MCARFLIPFLQLFGRKVYSLLQVRPHFGPLRNGRLVRPPLRTFSFLTFGQNCPTVTPVKGNEFIKRVRKLAKERGLSCQLDAARGKGSHVTLYLGDKLTIVRNPKDELKTGTYHAMLKQLGIDQEEL